MTLHMLLLRTALLPALLLGSAAAQADTGSDWLAKLIAPPKTLSDARAQCGDNAARPWSWEKFSDQRQAAADKLEAATRAKVSDPKFQQEMAQRSMAASMDPQSAMGQMQYSQYMAGLGTSSPDVVADTLFKPLFDKAQADATAAVTANNAKIKRCPTVPGGEMGPNPAPFCQKPIDADSAARKDAAANQYLASVAKAWPGFLKGAQDYFKKLRVVPDGVDPNNMNVQMQRDNIPLQELGSVQKMSEQAQQACENALQVSQLYVNGG